ncbi:hypothetical protein [Aestuariivirga sp.]|uniref:calcium-binding protein n=1 Tax=Aestuariivirga sp. TaxID=2650926 RepID=UPI0035944F18
MANFYGTLGIDAFVGAAFSVNNYYFDAGELSALDIVIGSNGGDYFHFNDAELSGLTGGGSLVNVIGIDRFYFNAGSNFDITNAMVNSADSTDPYVLTCHGSEERDVFDASAVTADEPIWLNGNDGNDELRGGGEGSLYEGGDGDDTIFLSSAVETAEGGNDDDLFTGDASDFDGDTINGGAGVDDIVLSSAGAFATSMTRVESVLLVNGTNTVTITSLSYAGGSDAVTHVEGGSGADTITIDPADSIPFDPTFENFLIEANGGNDILTGGDGNDTLDGGADTDALGGGAGDDVLIGGSGDDILSGGSGDDTYVDVGAGDLVNELFSTGTDTIETAVAVFSMQANIEILDYTGSADATLTGNTLGNTITGAAGDDTIHGDDGGDTLKGLKGDDTLVGEIGNDTLFGADGADIVRGGAGDDTLTGGRGADLIQGGQDNDTLNGGNGADTLEGGDGADILTGGKGSDSLTGGTGSDTASYAGSAASVDADLTRANGEAIHGADVDTLSKIESLTGGTAGDILRGDDGDNTLEGNEGDDILEGRGGNDTLYGGSGRDTADYSSTTESVVVQNVAVGVTEARGSDMGTDTLTGIEVIVGGGGDDSFFYFAEAVGNGGNDEFYATTGADIYDGGVGIDTVFYTGLNGQTGLVVDLENPALNQLNAAGDILTSIENITYLGSDYATMNGNCADNVIVTSGQLCGVDGRDGNDRVVASGIFDMLTGGNGVDTVDYSAATESVIVLQLDDGVLVGDDGAYGDAAVSFEAIIGSSHDDTITVNDAGTDSAGFALTGGNGHDTLASDAGTDTLSGGDGDDVLSGGLDGDVIDGGDGVDTLDYGVSDAAVTLALNNGSATGGHGEGDAVSNVENLTGSIYGDTFTGSSEANTLYGGDGRDRLNGGNGQDQLSGGRGGDTFVFLSANHSGADETLRDTILDFAAGDVIDLSAIDAQESSATTDEAFIFILDPTFSGEGQIRASQVGADTIVYVNTSGNGGTEMQIVLAGFAVGDLSAADFLL